VSGRDMGSGQMTRRDFLVFEHVVSDARCVPRLTRSRILQKRRMTRRACAEAFARSRERFAARRGRRATLQPPPVHELDALRHALALVSGGA
jgi:hypothetical protein